MLGRMAWVLRNPPLTKTGFRLTNVMFREDSMSTRVA